MNNALKWGVIYGLVLSIIALISHFMGLSDGTNTMMGIVVWLVSFAASIFIMFKGIQAFRDSNGGYMSLGNGVVQGLLIGLVGGIVLAIVTYVIFGVLSPDTLESIKEQAMAQNGDMDDDQAEMVGGIMDAMMSPGTMAGMEWLSEVIFGLIMGLIGGAILKRDRPIGSDTL